MRHPHALFLHPHTGRKGDDGTHNFHVWTWISRVGSEGTRHTTSMCVRESHAYVRRGRGTQLPCVYVNLTRRFGGDEDKRKGNYAERTKLQRAVIYIVPITNQCLSKCGTFITARDETNADVALNCFPNYMTQTFLPIRTNYDFNKFVNLACQNGNGI
jgi:hypothetical protein